MIAEVTIADGYLIALLTAGLGAIVSLVATGVAMLVRLGKVETKVDSLMSASTSETAKRDSELTSIYTRLGVIESHIAWLTGAMANTIPSQFRSHSPLHSPSHPSSHSPSSSSRLPPKQF